MRPWRIRAVGVLVLLGLLMIGPYGPAEFTVWFILLAVVLFAPIPSRFVRRRA